MTIDIAQKVREILVNQLWIDEEELTPEATFEEDLGADSLDVIEVVMALEEAFNIEIDEDKEMRLYTNVQKLIDGVSRKVDALGPPPVK